MSFSYLPLFNPPLIGVLRFFISSPFVYFQSVFYVRFVLFSSSILLAACYLTSCLV